MGSGREVRERNTKSQTPSPREIPDFKFQNLSQARCLGAWDLELLWCLVFGVWCLQLQFAEGYYPLLRRGAPREREKNQRRRRPQSCRLSRGPKGSTIMLGHLRH